MLRAFWTWDPVSCGEHRTFDEPHAYRNNKWFFDKSVWQKMFRAMSGCGFNSMFLANTHPFPFMIDLPEYSEAKLLDDLALGDYVRMHHWIFETAIEYDIAPYYLFFNIYYPEKLARSRGIDQSVATVPTDFALEYTHRCLRKLLSSYPELAGIVADASENISGRREQFLQQAVVEAVDAVRPDAHLYIRGWRADPIELTSHVSRRAKRPLRYSVKYTYEHLVDPNPDPLFARWVEVAGAENVAAELWVSNFEPWTSFSYETVEGIVSNLEDIGCDGFSLQPLALYDWPRTSDTYFRFQFNRDLVYYSTWGGKRITDMIREGQPKWLLRNQRLLPGFQASSRILELLALYFGADKQNQWHPQFCCIRDYDGLTPHLFSIEDMLHLGDQKVFWGREWWTEITGEPIVHLAEYVTSGTPPDAYGPEELMDELADLAEQAIAAGEKGMRSASGEKELPSFARDSLCMGRLGEFYIERLRAALAHARGNDKDAVEHMGRALGLFRDIRGIDSSHRILPIRVITGRCTIVYDWLDTIKALEAEHTDAIAGEFKRGSCYPIGKLEGTL